VAEHPGVAIDRQHRAEAASIVTFDVQTETVERLLQRFSSSDPLERLLVLA
jgi:hypothetical protein